MKKKKENLFYICDGKYRHLVCVPYSLANLHRMARELGIHRCWFHKDHYDIPKKRLDEIIDKSFNVSSKTIVKIIKHEMQYLSDVELEKKFIYKFLRS